MKELSIGLLARLTGVKVPTIRYYETIGLLPKPERLPNNRRTYGQQALQRLGFIRHARELGFEIASIRQLIEIAANPNRPCVEADSIARAHLADIDDKITRLIALKSELQTMTNCKNRRVSECRVIEVLADRGGCRGEHLSPSRNV